MIVCIIFFAIIFGTAWFATAGPLKVIEAQLAALNAGDYQTAYGYCSKGFKDVTSFDQFRGLCEGKEVRLRYSSSSPRRDGTSSKRIPAYVFVDNGGTPVEVNAEICRQGYTYWYSKYEHDRREEFRGYVDGAKREKKGFCGLKR